MVKQNSKKQTLVSVNPSRRKALKKIAAGGAVAGILALSGKWSKPVVDSIILPAHAQATNPEPPPVTTTLAPRET
ncbi:MAG TPA: twin-arginine translocation signal domain-containing protein [Desulfobulbaceae bacterium]|nr:twin-arginine translocation signal domain-containing protein [Desulfobulbaceae bacterium]